MLRIALVAAVVFAALTSASLISMRREQVPEAMALSPLQNHLRFEPFGQADDIVPRE